MGPSNIKWVQYCYLVKCVGFELSYKVGPVIFIDIGLRIFSNYIFYT